MKIKEETWALVGKLSTLVVIAIGSFYGVQAIANYRNVSKPTTDPDNNTGGTDNVPSPPNPSLLVNNIGNLVELTLSDGGKIRGFELPDDVNKVTFPLQIVTKPNTNLFGQGEAASFSIQKSAEGALFYHGMVNSVNGNYGITYNELKDQALAMKAS